MYTYMWGSRYSSSFSMSSHDWCRSLWDIRHKMQSLQSQVNEGGRSDSVYTTYWGWCFCKPPQLETQGISHVNASKYIFSDVTMFMHSCESSCRSTYVLQYWSGARCVFGLPTDKHVYCQEWVCSCRLLHMIKCVTFVALGLICQEYKVSCTLWLFISPPLTWSPMICLGSPCMWQTFHWETLVPQITGISYNRKFWWWF